MWESVSLGSLFPNPFWGCVMGVTVEVPRRVAPADQEWGKLGEAVLLVGLPIGMLFVSLLLLVNLLVSAGVGAQGREIDGQAAALIAYFFLMLPYSLAGGALEAVYGAHSRAVPCCFFIVVGVAVGIFLPVFVVSEMGLLAGTGRTWSLTAAGAVAQMLAAAAAWVLVRRSRAVQVLRGRVASG